MVCLPSLFIGNTCKEIHRCTNYKTTAQVCTKRAYPCKQYTDQKIELRRSLVSYQHPGRQPPLTPTPADELCLFCFILTVFSAFSVGPDFKFCVVSCAMCTYCHVLPSLTAHVCEIQSSHTCFSLCVLVPVCSIVGLYHSLVIKKSDAQQSARARAMPVPRGEITS